MPTPVAARKLTIFYPGGSCRAPRATLEKLLGTLQLGWQTPITDTEVEARRPYGSRQRTGSAAGEAMRVVFKDGDEYTVRITGTHKAFIAQVLSEGGASSVSQIVSERGTEYGERPQTVGEGGPGPIV